MLRGNLHDATHFFFGGARIDGGRTTAMPEAYVFPAVDDCSLIDVTSPTISLISTIAFDKFPSTCCRSSLSAECAPNRKQNRPSLRFRAGPSPARSIL
jgi:hypothetical protein